MPNILHNKHRYVLLIVTIIVLIVSFTLSLRRYQNYEFGKFDLGNMAQMVYNTSNFNLMEVTDQFGTNMPRSGMSHVDPILMIFAPLYKLIPHPMLLVFFQHVLLIVSIYPLYYLTKNFTKSNYAAYIFVGIYLSNTILGYTLVWTAFHGISFVAPLFIWVAYFLERNAYLKNDPSLRTYIAYWLLILLILMGKEQAGLLVAFGSFFLFLRNKKLSIITFVISMFWFLIAFFVIIPNNAHLRQQSINNLVTEAGLDINKTSASTKKNFFLNRYEYLGSSYFEIIKNAIIKPDLVYSKVVDENKLEELNYIFGATGYVQILNPMWLIAFPDHVINFLANEDNIYSITNHRSTTIFVMNVLALLYLIKFLHNKKFINSKGLNLILTIIFIHSIYISLKSSNPLVSPILNRLTVAIASEIEDSGRLPITSVACKDKVVEIINNTNVQNYTGPDYLGAHTANRRVNALFPANYTDADLVVIDMYDTKAINPLNYDNDWYVNQRIINRIFTDTNNRIVYSCDKLSVLDRSGDDSSIKLENDYTEFENNISYDGLKISISEPQLLYLNGKSYIELKISKITDGNLDSFLPYFEFTAIDQKLAYVDYYLLANELNINNMSKSTSISYQFPVSRLDLDSDNYNIIFGIGNRIEGIKVDLGTLEL